MLKKILIFIGIIFPFGAYCATITNSDIEQKYFTSDFVSQLQSLYPGIEKSGYSISNSNKLARSIRLTYKISMLPNSILDIRVSLYSSGISSKDMFKDASNEYSSRINDGVWLPVISAGNNKGFDLVKKVTSKANPKYINTSRRLSRKWRDAIYFIKNNIAVEIIYSPEFSQKNIYTIGKTILGIKNK